MTTDKTLQGIYPKFLNNSLAKEYTVATSPDGNCFFRAASITLSLSGSENNHLHIRCCLVCFIAANARIFSPLVMQYSDMDAHIKTMMQPCAWATQLEIVALATYFQVPVYIFKESTGQWERHKPLPNS